MNHNLPFQHQQNSDLYTSESDASACNISRGTQHNDVILERRSLVGERRDDGPVELAQIRPQMLKAPEGPMSYGAHPHSARNKSKERRATSGR